MKALVLTLGDIGVGHMMRSKLLAEALREHFEVEWLVSTFPEQELPAVEGVSVKRFLSAPLFEQEGYRRLPKEYQKTWHESIAAWPAAFAKLLEGEYAFFLTESFPLSKTNYDDALRAMVTHFRLENPTARVYCSSKGMSFGRREDLEEKERLYFEELMRFSEEITRKYYDRIFLHGDPSFISMEDEVPVSKDILQLYLRYTGFVVPTAPLPRTRKKLIVVSGGSGLDIEGMHQKALAAAKEMPEYTFRFLLGPKAKEIKSALPNVVSGPFVENFSELLSDAAAAVTQCGSTLLNLYACKTPAIVYPSKFSVDQELMCEKFAAIGAVQRGKEDLLSQLQELLAKPYEVTKELDMRGVERTVKMILKECL